MTDTPATDLTKAVAAEKAAATSAVAGAEAATVSAVANVEKAGVTFFQKYWYWFALGTAVVGNLVGVVYHF